MTNKLLYLDTYHKDGMKSSLLWDEETDAWTYTSGGPKTDVEKYYQGIPTIFRGIGKISQAVGSMPFNIYGKSGDEPIDTSEDYENNLGWLPSPRATFEIASKSLDLMGQAYFLMMKKERSGAVAELRYVVSKTIEPKYDKNTTELLGFERTVNNTEKFYKPEEILYMWLPDPYKEQGPPDAYPAVAALRAAGVLANLDDFIAVYFERGAVRPMVVTAKGVVKKAERERMEKWFTQLLGGIKNALSWKIFEAETVSIDQVGDGLSELRDVELTTQRREDIAVALNIPYTILYPEAANFATAKQDKITFYQDAVIPRCKFISEVMNEQIFVPMGYRLEYLPQTLEIMQEDEAERADSLVNLVNATIPVLTAMGILGYDLTDEQRLEIEKAMEQKEENREEMSNRLNQGGNNRIPVVSQQETEMGKWMRKSLNSLAKGKSADVPFVSEIIPAALHGAVCGALSSATDTADVAGVFNDAFLGYP
jgi:phage portal protein BeeE